MAPADDDSSSVGTSGVRTGRRRQTGVRTLIVLVACCAAILGAWRSWLENSDPRRVVDRAVQSQAIAALRSSEPTDRVSAIVTLQRLYNADASLAIPPLSEALGDRVTAVRLAAAEAFQSMAGNVANPESGDEAVRVAVMALIRCLKDPEPLVRDAAVKALHAIGDSMAHSGSGAAAARDAVPVLRRHLTDPEPGVRSAAAAGLGDIISPETVRDAAAALMAGLKDPEPEVRSTAASSLGNLASSRLASRMASQLDRHAVIVALAEVLDDRDAKVRLTAMHATVEHSIDPTRKLARARQIPTVPGQERHPSTDPPRILAKALRDESPENRVAAIRLLSTFDQGLDPWIPVLLGLAEHDSDPSVREACFDTLRTWRPPAITAGAVPGLIPSLKSDNASVRGQAAMTLHSLGRAARVAIPELLRVLNEPIASEIEPAQNPTWTIDPGSAAARALGRIAPKTADAPRVIAALIDIVRSGPPSRRGPAAGALGEFGPAAGEAVSVLIKAVNNASDGGEASMAGALGDIAPGTSAADQAVTAILPVLESKHWTSRYMAAQALGKFGANAAAAIPRIHALKNDPDPDIRQAAAEALVAIEKASSP